jgi:sulfite reductase alpha subunit-like flavoprotein
MLTAEQLQIIDSLLSNLSRDQQIWLAGYVQGRSSTSAIQVAQAEKQAVNIYYATETGNSKALSLQLMKEVKAAGFKVKNTAVNRLDAATIDAKQISIFLCSTHGEGEPPESALTFFASLKALKDGSLQNMPFAVLGLGDKSYEIFCGAATDLQGELLRLGAVAFQEIALFDVDYALHTPTWIADTVRHLNALQGDSAAIAPAPVTQEQVVKTGKGYSRLEPIIGTVKEIINLNDRGSAKQTYHIEITYDADVRYTCGDSAGIIVPSTGEAITPRLYSIASAPSLHEGEIHLTVALATYKKENGEIGYGIASRYLANLQAGDEVTFYIAQNQIFNLPADTQDAIMIGPGTGIAPFRSFVWERSERGAEGRNWVLYGDQHAHCDFLYQAEWQEHLATNVVQRMDVAFSRDTSEKVYVQHKLRRAADEFIAWLDGGAALYICGAKDPMSRDVEAEILNILIDKKGLSSAAAQEYLGELEEQGRYVKDVY